MVREKGEWERYGGERGEGREEDREKGGELGERGVGERVRSG